MELKAATSIFVVSLWLLFKANLLSYATTSNNNLSVARVSNNLHQHESRTTRYSKPKQDNSEEDHKVESQDSLGNSNQCNFGGKLMKIAVSSQPPFVNCDQNLLGEWHCNGSNIEIVNVLAERFNFQTEWVVLTQSHWNSASNNKLNAKQERKSSGELNPNPTLNITEFESSGESLDLKEQSIKYTGVLGLVAKGRALMSANGIIETEERTRDLLISEAFDSFRLHLLLSKSVREHDHIFIKPFSPQTWTAILMSALAIIPVFYLINTTTLYHDLKDDKTLSKLSIWICIKFIITKFFLDKRHKRSRRNKNESRLSILSSSSISTLSSFDDQIDQLASAPIALVDLSIQTIPSPKKVSKQMRRFIRQKRTLDRKRVKKLTRLARKSGFFKVAYLAWYVVSSLANQGGETEDLPTANSTRVLLAFWWLYLIVVVAIHAGILTAILTFPKQNDYIQTLDDYLDLSAYDRTIMKLSVDKNSEIAYFLSKEDNYRKSPLQLILSQAAKEFSPYDNSDLQDNVNFEVFHQVDFSRYRARVLDEIQVGHCALIEEKSTIDQLVTQEYFDHKPPKCLFKSSRFAIDVIPMHFVFSKSLMSPNCLKSFNSILRLIMKTGLAIKWRRLYEAPGNDCLDTVIINAGDVDKIEYRHVEAAFWLLMAGLLIGSVVLILELVWLFTLDDDGDDDDQQSSSSDSGPDSTESSQLSSSEESDDSIKLGHKITSPGETIQVRSLNIKKRLKKLNLDKPDNNSFKAASVADRLPSIPTIVLPIELNTSLMDEMHENLRNAGKKSQIKKQKKIAKVAKKRARRLKRTLDLVKRLQEGRIYSQKLRKQVRRASHAIVSKITPDLGGSSHSSAKNNHKRPSITITSAKRHNLTAVAPESW